MPIGRSDSREKGRFGLAHWGPESDRASRALKSRFRGPLRDPGPAIGPGTGSGLLRPKSPGLEDLGKENP